MAANEIHVGDIGTIFEITFKDWDVVVNISAATTKTLYFKKPDGSKLAKAGAFTTDGTDGKLRYTAVSGDLSLSGTWKVQGYVITPSGTWYTDISTFTVYANL